MQKIRRDFPVSIAVAATGQRLRRLFLLELAEGKRVVETPCHHQCGGHRKSALQPLHGKWFDAGTEFVKLVLRQPQQRNGAETEGEGELCTLGR